jgi:hypothetical protein
MSFLLLLNLTLPFAVLAAIIAILIVIIGRATAPRS